MDDDRKPETAAPPPHAAKPCGHCNPCRSGMVHIFGCYTEQGVTSAHR
jgi:NADH:ubiquinone oxidoreductase subunit F (NADH-binding)